jgi:hypothetical protein
VTILMSGISVLRGPSDGLVVLVNGFLLWPQIA